MKNPSLSMMPKDGTFFLIWGLLLLLGCGTASLEKDPIPGVPFMGIVPTNTPQMLFPDHISSLLVEYNGTFSPDGREFYYTSEVGGKGYITFTHMDENNNWTPPEIASFSGQYSEYDPLFSPDGSSLFFSSQRPISDQNNENQSRIWVVDRKGKGWGSPRPLILSNQGDYYCSVSEQGNIYYNIWNTGNILKASPSDTGYVSQELPEVINGKSDVGDPFISPDEDYLIFRGYFDSGYGRGDLYISFQINGQWTEPENLGEPINSSAHEICPYVTSDGKLFIFASDRLKEYYSGASLEALQGKYQSSDNGHSNIYYMSTEFIPRMKAKHIQANP